MTRNLLLIGRTRQLQLYGYPSPEVGPNDIFLLLTIKLFIKFYFVQSVLNLY